VQIVEVDTGRSPESAKNSRFGKSASRICPRRDTRQQGRTGKIPDLAKASVSWHQGTKMFQLVPVSATKPFFPSESSIFPHFGQSQVGDLA
jgi:hypothetical protein